MGKTARESVVAAIAAMVAIAAALALAPAAYADEAVVATPAGVTSNYALLRSDGYLVPCDSSGHQISEVWSGTKSDAITSVHTAYIASDVRSFPNTFKVNLDDGEHDARFSNSQGGSFYYISSPRVETVVFLGSECTTITARAFENMYHLGSISIPDSVRSIGDSAFEGCVALYEINLGSSLRSIGSNAFKGCVSLAEIDLPPTLTTISSSYLHGSFIGSGLTKVTMRSAVPVSDSASATGIKEAFKDTPILQPGNNACIYVPTSSLTAYRMHYGDGGKDGDGWSYFNQNNLDKLRGLDGEPTDISNASVTLSQASYTYDGKAKAPSVTVTLGSSKLKQGASANDYATADYTVSYADNVDAGTATVTVAGIGLYAGTKTATFTISKPASTGKGSGAMNNDSEATGGGKSDDAKAANTLVVTPKTAKVSKSKKAKTIARSKVLAVSRAQGTVTYKKLSGNKKITVNPKNGKVTVKGGLKKKTYKVKVRVTAAGNGNYEAGYRDATFKVKVK